MDSEIPSNPLENGIGSRHGGARPGAGRPATHSHRRLRQTLTLLTTKRLDGRSAVAVPVRQFKADVTADLGGDLSRAQQTILEDAAQS